MASKYLKDFLKELTCKSTKKKAIKKALKSCLESVKIQIKQKVLTIQKRKRFKKRENLESPEKSFFKFNQKEYMTDFKEKAESNRAFTLRLMKEQQERRQRLEEKEEELKQQQLDEERQKEIDNYYTQQEKEKQKEDQLRALLEKSKHRKLQMKKLKEISERDFRKVVSTTPLYKKIESEFVSNVEMPELAKRKEELRKKHELFKPWDYDELRERCRYLEISQNQHKPQTIFNERSKSTRSKFLQRILEEDREKFLFEAEKSEIKKDLKDKVKKYSQIVKEVFPPSVDMLKKKEMELIKAKLSSPALFIKKDQPIERTYSFSPRKFKKNPMVPEKPEKKTPETKDYLLEFRKQRKRSLSDQDLKSLSIDQPEFLSDRRLKKVIEKYDKEARLGEMKIELMSPFNSKSIKYSEQVNGMLVNSIRTKIAILEKQ
jgi:hypothetical protein